MNKQIGVIAKIYIFTILTLCSELAFSQVSTNCLDEECLEKLHFDSVRINSKIALKLKDAELERLLGKPDSVVVENWECGNYIDSEENVRVLYYGNTRFISSNGMSLLHILDFEDGRFTFDFVGVQFRSGTSKADCQRLFPNSLKALEDKVQSYNKRGVMKVKMLPPYEEGNNGWLFTFDGEQLKEIELWWMIC